MKTSAGRTTIAEEPSHVEPTLTGETIPTQTARFPHRLIHNAYRLSLSGDSMRKIHSPLNDHDN
jgi:hypothetical protein